MIALRVRVLDENGNLAPYAQLPLRFETQGPVRLVGPNVATAEGGMGGTYLRTVGASGNAVCTVCAPGCEEVSVTLKITGRKQA